MKEPKIRFKEFEGEWETSRLDSCVDFLDNLRKPIEEGNRIKGIYPYYGASGIVDYVNDYIFVEELILLSEDGANITDRNYPVCFLASGKYWVNNHAHVLKAKDGFVNCFVSNAMERKDYSQYNTGMAMPKLNKEVCKNIPLTYPLIEEQQSIASFFTTIDAQISASTSRLASLKQIKAASLQAMFPQEGETVPKLRFKGFEGEWKKVSFLSLFDILKNNSLTRAELNGVEGDVICIHYGDVLIKYGDLLDVNNEEVCFISDAKKANILYSNSPLKEGDVIIADAAEDSTVGKCVELINISEMKVVAGLHTIPCRPKLKMAAGFIGHYLNSSAYHNQLLPLIQGTKISSISKKTLSLTYLMRPSFSEQQSIASYFTNLDRQITLQSQRLEKLKQIKAACLDKMFV